MSTIVQELKTTTDENDRLSLILKHFHCDSGTIHKLNESDGLLHPVAEGPGITKVHDKIQSIRVGKGLAGQAVERNEPVTVSNLDAAASPPGDVRQETGLQGVLVVPIRDASHNDKAVGALGVATKAERTFTEAEIADLLECGQAIA